MSVQVSHHVAFRQMEQNKSENDKVDEKQKWREASCSKPPEGSEGFGDDDMRGSFPFSSILLFL